MKKKEICYGGGKEIGRGDIFDAVMRGKEKTPPGKLNLDEDFPDPPRLPRGPETTRSKKVKVF